MAKEKNASNAGARQESGPRVRQHQASTQSMDNPSKADDQRSDANSDQQVNSGIGSTAGQNRGGDKERTSEPSQRPSAGTPDLPRERATHGDIEREGGSQDSLVNEPTGAFKERP